MRGLFVALAGCAPTGDVDVPSDHPSHLLLASGADGVFAFALERDRPAAAGVSGELDLFLMSFDEPLDELGLAPGLVPIVAGRTLPAELAEALRSGSTRVEPVDWVSVDGIPPRFDGVGVEAWTLAACLASGGCFSRATSFPTCKMGCDIDPPMAPMPPNPPDPPAPPRFRCPTDWSPIPGGGCMRALPAAPACAGPREAAFYGEAACTPLDRPCTAPTPALSVPSEFPTIAEALDAAGSGDTVHVAGGTYAEPVVVGAGVTLYGCPEATLSGTASTAVVVRGAGARVEGLIIEGFQEGLRVEAAASAIVTSITITGPSSAGIVLEGPADVERAVIRGASIGAAFRSSEPSSIRSSVIENAAIVGLEIQAPVSIEAVAVRWADVGVGSVSSVQVDGLEITGARSAITAVGGTIVGREVVVRATATGIAASNARIQISGTDMEVAGTGVSVETSTMSLTIARVDMLGTGDAISARLGSVVEADQARLERSNPRTILVTESRLSLRDTMIASAPQGPTSPAGRLIDSHAAAIGLERVVLQGTGTQTGLVVGARTVLTARDIRGVALDHLVFGIGRVEMARAATSTGTGLQLFDSATASVSDLDVIGAYEDFPVFASDGASLELRRARLRIANGKTIAGTRPGALLLEDIDAEVREPRIGEASGIDFANIRAAPTTIRRARITCATDCVQIKGLGQDLDVSDLAITSGGAPFKASYPGGLGTGAVVTLDRVDLRAGAEATVADIEVVGTVTIRDLHLAGGLEGLDFATDQSGTASRLDIGGSRGACLTIRSALVLDDTRLGPCETGVVLTEAAIPALLELEMDGVDNPIHITSE